MRESKNNNKGFSLVEMLVAVTILVIVVAPLSQVLISSSKVNQKTKKTMSATDMAQNMFESIKTKGPEHAIVELSSLAYSDNVVLDKPLSIIPGGMAYDGIGEFASVIDPATGVETVSKAGGSGTYVLSKVADPATGAVRCKGFKESSNSKYMFWIKGLRNSNTYYDLRITLDASAYNTNYTAPNPNSTDYESIPNIYNVNGAYDGIYVEGPTALENVVKSEYNGKHVKNSVLLEDILKKLERTYTVEIKDIGTTSSNIVASIKKEYRYTDPLDHNAGYDGLYYEGEECFFDSSTFGADPRNLYVYYTPNYHSTNKGTAALDQLVVDNQTDKDINVYFIRMEQTTATAGVLKNETTTGKEQLYTATVQIKEPVINLSDLSTINTRICTNLGDDITKHNTLAEYEQRQRTDTSLITYKLNSYTEAESRAALESAEKIKGLDAREDEKRIYDVTVDVYMGKSDGKKKDYNANSSYAGAYENDFPEGAKLTTFTSSIVQ